MFIIPIYLFSEIFPGVSRGPICSSCTRAHSPVWPPLNLLRIVDLRRRRSNSADGRPNSGASRRADFSVCVPPIFGRFDAVADLVEFVEVSRVFGAEKFQLYNSSIGSPVDRCVREYVSRGVVDVQPWNLPTDIARSVHYHGHILAINDCLYRLMYRTGHLLVHDLDEFVVPMRSENWRAMLSDVAEKHARSTDSDRIASYSFRNRFFPTRPASRSNLLSDGPIQSRLRTLSVTRARSLPSSDPDRSKVMAVVSFYRPGIGSRNMAVQQRIFN